MVEEDGVDADLEVDDLVDIARPEMVVEEERVGAGSTLQHVFAGAAIQKIGAGTALQRVFATTAVELVVTACRLQQVLAGPAEERVMTGSGRHLVVATLRFDNIVAIVSVGELDGPRTLRMELVLARSPPDRRASVLADRDIEGGGAEGARRVAGAHCDGVAGRQPVVEQAGVGDGHDAGLRVNREAAAGIIGERIGNRSAVDVAGERSDADLGAGGRAIDDLVCRAVHIGGRARRHIRDADGQVLLKAVAGGIGDLHRDGLGLSGFVVDRLGQNQIGAGHRKVRRRRRRPGRR